MGKQSNPDYPYAIHLKRVRLSKLGDNKFHAELDQQLDKYGHLDREYAEELIERWTITWHYQRQWKGIWRAINQRQRELEKIKEDSKNL